MSDSNRVRLAYVEEATLGTTPAITNDGTAQASFRNCRITGESLNFQIGNIISNELRSDRNVPALVQVDAKNQGGFNFELSFPEPRSFLDQFLGGALFSDWVKTAESYNLTADTVITGVTDSSDTFTLASGGTAYKVGHLVRAEGFTNAANNALFVVSSSTGTTVVMAATPTLVDEAAPPAGARLKVVGARGAVSDIVTSAGGLTSTVLDFTTLGWATGQWLKLSGFSTGANNAFVRIVTVAATAVTLDNKPSGWTSSEGAALTITMWASDYLRNGISKRSFTLEKGFLDHSPINYATYLGCVVGGVNMNFESGKMIEGDFSLLGMTHAAGAASLGTPASSLTNTVMSAAQNVGRLAENGAVVATPNFVKSFSLQLNNNLREQQAVGNIGLIGIGAGRCEVAGKMMTYFGDRTLYDKYVAGTPTNLNARTQIDSQAIILTMPNVKFESGSIVAQGANQDVMMDIGYRAILDPVTNCEIQFDRFEEYV